MRQTPQACDRDPHLAPSRLGIGQLPLLQRLARGLQHHRLHRIHSPRRAPRPPQCRTIAGMPRLGGVRASAGLRGCAAGRSARSRRPQPGAAGSGDSFYPAPRQRRLRRRATTTSSSPTPRSAVRSRARSTITATATQELTSFSLDMRRWLRARAVTVNGIPAASRQQEAKLFVTPSTRDRERRAVHGLDPLPRQAQVGRRLRRPPRGLDPDPGRAAWSPPSPRGPRAGSRATPSLTDKASWEMRVRRPQAAEGDLQRPPARGRGAGRKRVWRWAESQPMVAYLATVAIGRFRLHPLDGGAACPRSSPWTPRCPAASPRASSAPPASSSSSPRSSAPTRSTRSARSSRTGRPASRLETQTRPIYDFAPPGGIHAHEIAHQCFGDSVGFGRWQDIWLAEGFAQWSMWLWRDFVGNQTLEVELRARVLRPGGGFFSGFYWRPAPGAIGSARTSSSRSPSTSAAR